MHSPDGFFVLRSRPLHAANCQVTLLIVHSTVSALSFSNTSKTMRSAL